MLDPSTGESLFQSLMLPLYADEVRGDLATARRTDANPAQNHAIFAQLDDIADVFSKMATHAFGRDLVLDRSDASVHRLSEALTRDVRDRLLRERDESGVPVLAHVIIHGAIYVGACVVKNHEGTWRVRTPLWESLVGLKSRAGEGDLALLSWMLRALSDAEIDRGTLAERYRLHVEVPRMKPEDLPILASPDRVLPRLKRPKYDQFHRYLRAHIPELRDVGEHFPSPERFAELAFSWLDFVLVGGGRQLVIHGPTDSGVHVIWMDSAGFVKSAFYPADAFPEHMVKLDGEKLIILLPMLGKNIAHEMLWWGLLTSTELVLLTERGSRSPMRSA